MNLSHYESGELAMRRLIVSGSLPSLAVALSPVQAGQPSWADNACDEFDLSELAPHPDDTFVATVRGDSMMDAGIAPGDRLIVDRSLSARNGQVVVALVNGAELTVKEYVYDADIGYAYLRARSSYHANIYPEDVGQIEIWGVVTHHFRKLVS